MAYLGATVGVKTEQAKAQGNTISQVGVKTSSSVPDVIMNNKPLVIVGALILLIVGMKYFGGSKKSKGKSKDK